MRRRPPRPTLFPYTTLFRSLATDPTAGWAPLGFEDVVIRSLNGRLELGFNPANPVTPISIKVGAEANLTVFGKNAAGAIQIGADIGVPPGFPTAPVVTPNFDGFRIAMPTGISKGELVRIYDALAGALGMPEELNLDNALDGVPD